MGDSHAHINILVVYGIAGNISLNHELWEAVMCNCTCPGNARLMILTNANFDFDKLLKIPPASITALADGWLVDLDLVYIQTHGVPCFIK